MQLHLLRHADAGDPGAWDGPDAARPLSDKGRRQSERLGSFLASIGFSTDALVTSPKVRAAQTAEIVGGLIGQVVDIDPRLGDVLDLAAVGSVLRSAGDPSRPVLVGHDPDFSDLVAMLCGARDIPMRKGAIARIDLDGPLRPSAGTLRWLIPPDALKPSS